MINEPTNKPIIIICFLPWILVYAIAFFGWLGEHTFLEAIHLLFMFPPITLLYIVGAVLQFSALSKYNEKLFLNLLVIFILTLPINVTLINQFNLAESKDFYIYFITVNFITVLWPVFVLWMLMFGKDRPTYSY